MRAFESIRTRIDTEDTDALYARDFSHVPCLCRDRQMPVDTSRIQPTIDRVGARTSPESALKPKPLIFKPVFNTKKVVPVFKLQYCLWICPWGHLPFWHLIPVWLGGKGYLGLHLSWPALGASYTLGPAATHGKVASRPGSRRYQ